MGYFLIQLKIMITQASGCKLVKGKAKKAALRLQLDPSLPAEGYKLDVKEKQVVVTASRPAGFFYALQTLQQLLPSRAVLAGTVENEVTEWTLPVVSIADEPRFGWRGFMLDEGRLIQSGFRGGQGTLVSNEFDFSVERKDVADSLMRCSGKVVELHYKEYKGSLAWRGMSEYVVDSIISVKSPAIGTLAE